MSLRTLAKTKTPDGSPSGSFSARVRIHTADGPPLEEWAVREDRQVLESEEEGQPIYRTQRVYIVPVPANFQARWTLEDLEEGTLYRILGLNETPDGRYTDIVVKREVA